MKFVSSALHICSGRYRKRLALLGAGACLGAGLGTVLADRLGVDARVGFDSFAADAFALRTVDAAPVAPEIPRWGQDSDGDGLQDTCERVLGMDPFQSDTDGDGFSDLYEFTAFGDPHSSASAPSTTSFTRPYAYQLDASTIRFSFFIFEPSGRSQTVLDRWGLIYRERWEDASPLLPMVRFQRRFDQLGSAAPAGAAVFEVGYNTPRNLFTHQDPNYLGWHLYFSANWGPAVVHGVFNLRQVHGLLVETVFATTPPSGGGGGQLGASFATFRPFDAGVAEASAWQRNRACMLFLSSSAYQQRETGLAWFPVRAASCEPMSFAFCAPGCTSTEWSIQNSQAVRVLDPFALAGL